MFSNPEPISPRSLLFFPNQKGEIFGNDWYTFINLRYILLCIRSRLLVPVCLFFVAEPFLVRFFFRKPETPSPPYR